jgi:hypothetical protein
MNANAGRPVPPEVHMLLTDSAPVECVGAAVRACARSNGFEQERGTRFQVLVEELIREARMRKVATTRPVTSACPWT